MIAIANSNPLATADARAVEERAMRLRTMAQVEAGKDAARKEWLKQIGTGMTAEAKQSFDSFMEEFAFCYVLKAANGDGNYPKVATPIFAPPHEWMGLRVPGSRGGGSDSPDNSYSFMPVDYGPRYAIHGRRFEPTPADTPFTLTDNICFTTSLSHLDGSDLRVASDGRFTLTLDPEPANGRPNHIQTKPNCLYVFSRESRSDWRQMPSALSIERLDPPARDPLSDDVAAERAAQMMIDGVEPIWSIIRLWRSLEPNVIASPRNTGDFGGFVSQKFTMARLILEDDEAFVATICHGGAAFRNFVAEDFWLRTLDYWRTTSSMNNSQGLADPDGRSTTYVVSRQDPGVHNWINPGHLREVCIINRWQGLPRNPVGEGEPSAAGVLIKTRDLDSVLPHSAWRMTPAERIAQLSERQTTFGLRFADGRAVGPVT